MEWHRLGWKIDLVLALFKSLALVGPLPKRDDESEKALLYELLLVDKLIACPNSNSPRASQPSSPSTAKRQTEFGVALTQVGHAIGPSLPLSQTIADRNEIPEQLYEK